jgi:hypothetical protein
MERTFYEHQNSKKSNCLEIKLQTIPKNKPKSALAQTQNPMFLSRLDLSKPRFVGQENLTLPQN